MTTIQIEIKSAERAIRNALTELRKLYNDNRASLKDMLEIADFAEYLNTIDYEKTITN